MNKYIKKIVIKLRIDKFKEKIMLKKQSLLLQNVGEEALFAFFNVANQLKINFIPFFGTLLGIYRNHDFIKHDDDIDVVLDIRCLSDDLLISLRKHGFEFNSIFVSSDFKGCQLPMKYKGLTCDINFLYVESDKISHIYIPLEIKNHDWTFSGELNLFRCQDLVIPSIQEFIQYPFRNTEVMIPQNTKEILTLFYGKSFMIPKKKKAHHDPELNKDPLYAKSFFPLYVKSYRKIPIEFFKESAFFDQVLRHFKF